MYNATTIIIISCVLLFVLVILIHKINRKYISKPDEGKEKPSKEHKEETKRITPPLHRIRHSYNFGGLTDGYPPDLFARKYKPNQRKRRKKQRQNPNACI